MKPRALLEHVEGHVALERAARRDHPHNPEVAPEGTVARIKVCESTVKMAAVALKVTLVAPVKSVPKISTAAPILPAEGCVSTNAPRPVDRL